MSENTENTQESQPVEETPVVDVGADVEVPQALREVDPAKLAEVRKKLANFIAKRGTTVSGAEDPDSPVATEGVTPMGGTDGENPMGETITGADVDWSEYDLDYSVRHLYPKAIFRDTPQGPKWVATLDEFFTTERAFKMHGKNVNAPGTTDKEHQEPLNLGEYLTQMVNGPDGWTIAAILPGSAGHAGIIMKKGTNVVLPDPQQLKKMEEVEAPKDQELASIEAAALDFAAEEGLTPPGLPEDESKVLDQNSDEITQDLIDAKDAAVAADFARRALGRGAVDVEEGTGALPARDSNLIRRAIDRNRAESAPPPVPSGIQPPALDPSRIEGGKVLDGAAGVENVREGLRNLLDNGNLPQA